MTELTVFSWLSRKLDWASEVLIYFNRNSNKLNFSAFNRKEWQVFSLLPASLSYSRVEDKADKEQFVHCEYTEFFSHSYGICRMLSVWGLVTTEVTKMPGAMCWLHKESPALWGHHPIFIKTGVPLSLLSSSNNLSNLQAVCHAVLGNPRTFHLVKNSSTITPADTLRAVKWLPYCLS